MGQVTATKTSSRNKVEFGTIGPIPPEGVNGGPGKAPDNGNNGDDDEMFNDIPS
jgi:hypothetical protein